MSEHADITGWAVAEAVAKNFSFDDLLDHVNCKLRIADYEDDMLYGNDDVHELVRSTILTQRDGLFGSHESARKWIIEHPNLNII